MSALAEQITEAEVELAKWTVRLKKLWDEEQAASNLRTPYVAGRMAFEEGSSLCDNPHLPATNAWADWRKGWLDADVYDMGEML